LNLTLIFKEIFMTFDFKNLAKALLTTCLIASSNAQGDSNPAEENLDQAPLLCKDSGKKYAFWGEELGVMCDTSYGNTGGKVIAAEVYRGQNSDDLVAIISYKEGYVVKCSTLPDAQTTSPGVSTGGSKLCTSKMGEVYNLYKKGDWGKMPPGYIKDSGYINNISN